MLFLLEEFNHGREINECKHPLACFPLKATCVKSVHFVRLHIISKMVMGATMPPLADYNTWTNTEMYD